jgi:hypothetical protein
MKQCVDLRLILILILIITYVVRQAGKQADGMSQNTIDLLQFEIKPKINVSLDQVDQYVVMIFGSNLSCLVSSFSLKLCPLVGIKQFIAEFAK